MKVTVKAYAKINLLLDILGKLENGYHDLFMVMQSIGIFDTVEVESTQTQKIEIICDKDGVPNDERNIAHKAARAFFDFSKIKNPGLKITLEKSIPHAAGLAGGSADGAAVVRALDKIFETKLSDRQIVQICSTFGSDVAFCALGGTMLAQGTGNVLTYLPQLKIENLVVVKPDCSVSTAEAYKAFDTAERIRHPDCKGMLNAVFDSDVQKASHCVDNVFEQFIDIPERIEIKSVMRSHNALCACMSGSGPSVFGIFESKEDAELCAQRLKKTFSNTFLCSSKETGCEII